jgi:hypothetical protein
LTQPAEVHVPPDLLERILELVGTDMILVGGQALAFWAAYYHTSAPSVAITKDVDLLGTRADVERLARGLGGKAVFPHKKEMTLLVGQVMKDLPGGNYVNIDVMLRVYGDITTEAIITRSVVAESPAGRFRVMHPLDVLQGRLENVHGLAVKQDEHGVAQLRLAVEMARKFVSDIGSQEAIGAAEPGRPVAVRHLARIEALALSDAGRKVAKRYGVHVADAVDPAPVEHIKAFVSKKLPQLLKLMSDARRTELGGTGLRASAAPSYILTARCQRSPSH